MGPIFLPGSPAPVGAKDFRMGLFNTIQIGPAPGGPGGSMSPPPGKPPSGTPPSVPPVNVFAPIQGGGGPAGGGPGRGSAFAALGPMLTSGPAVRGDVTRAGTMAGSGAMFGTGLPELGVGLGTAIPSRSSASRVVLGDVTRAVAIDFADGTSVVGVRGDVTRVIEIRRTQADRFDPFRKGDTDLFDHSRTGAIAQDPGAKTEPENKGDKEDDSEDNVTFIPSGSPTVTTAELDVYIPHDQTGLSDDGSRKVDPDDKSARIVLDKISIILLGPAGKPGPLSRWLSAWIRELYSKAGRTELDGTSIASHPSQKKKPSKRPIESTGRSCPFGTRRPGGLYSSSSSTRARS